MSILVKSGAPKWVERYAKGDKRARPFWRADTRATAASIITILTGAVIGAGGAIVGVDTGIVAGVFDGVGLFGTLCGGMWTVVSIGEFDIDYKYLHVLAADHWLMKYRDTELAKWLEEPRGLAWSLTAQCDAALEELAQLEGEKWQNLEDALRATFRRLCELGATQDKLETELGQYTGQTEADTQYRVILRGRIDEAKGLAKELQQTISEFVSEIHRMVILQKLAKLQGNTLSLSADTGSLRAATEDARHVNEALAELTQVPVVEVAEPEEVVVPKVERVYSKRQLLKEIIASLSNDK